MKKGVLQGQTALVTGAGRRVGKEIARALGRAGCHLIVHYSSSKQGAEEVVNEIRSFGQEAFAVRADFQKKSEVQSLVKEVSSQTSKLDILINSASFFPEPEKLESSHFFLEENEESFEKAITINAQAPFFLAQGLSPLLKKSGNGQIVNILDESLDAPFASRAGYSVSKAALLGVQRVTAEAFFPEVRVNALLLPSVIPDERMRGEDQKKLIWSGMEPVRKSLLSLLESKQGTGNIIRVP